MARLCQIGIGVLLLVSLLPCAGADQPERALKVSGYGLFGNLELKRLLQLLAGDETNEFYAANFIEDAAIVLMSELERDGYLQPTITARVTLDDGTRQTFRWRTPLAEPLPRPLRARRIHFHVREGVLYHYRNIQFAGLQTIDESEALTFFVETRGLLNPVGNRVYTPEQADASVDALRQALERDGYAETVVTLTNLQRNEVTGEVDVTVQVRQGRRHLVRSVRVEEVGAGVTNAQSAMTMRTNQPYSSVWVQDFAQQLRRRHYQEGYPDANAELAVLRSNVAEVVMLDLVAQVNPGPKVRTGNIRFLGQEHTREGTMRRRVELEAGEPLDRIKAEQGRFKLARLGVFDSVELRYDVVDDHTRDVIYEVNEGERIEFSLLAGFGSYELLRGGFILEQHNVWGRAHNSRLKAIQSFKSSSGEYTYTIPQFRWGSDLFFNASGLRREELDFTREELAASMGAKRYFTPIATEASLRYSYQYVNAARADFVEGFGVPHARVAAMILDLRHDRRDNPISPRRGHKLFSNFEVASQSLGGEVDYQRLELHGSYHWPLNRDQWIHFGASHGAVFSVGDSQNELPFNKRFFPGGESSIRGYQLGEASPLNEQGKIVGAESYLGLNLEFEQALTPEWSVVVLFDAMGVAQDIGQYPFDELLFSVGGGLRWNTLIGPVRLEYGYNLHRRRHDPAGTLHLSVGFPF